MCIFFVTSPPKTRKPAMYPSVTKVCVSPSGARLCRDPSVAREVVKLGGAERLVRLCKDEQERNHSDAVLVACLVSICLDDN